ncbi:MAG: DUF903 domain-containing protein [Phycisphaerales bacterium]|nr:DUF903 domain-containing protein [Phycisphaerales bacterium]
MITRRTARALSLVGLCSFCFVSGCGHYYRVTDPTTEKDYYTTKVEYESGSVRFEDASGKDVMLNNAEVQSVSKSEYKKGRRK